jgi:glycosyltransferase involved in cell wall biosynthesis
MGAWLDRVERTPKDGYESRRIVFLGHLVPRQGVDILLRTVRLLVDRGEDVTADIVGTGPLEDELRRHTEQLGLAEVIRFHGFVPDHREVERILAGGAVALAPYRSTEETFTRYADPGKLKAYLAAGLPIVLTDVPPNAIEVAQDAGAELVDGEPEAFADAISAALTSPADWQMRRSRALAYAQRFDWPVLLGDLLDELGLAVSAASPSQAADESTEVRDLARNDRGRFEQADGEGAEPKRSVQTAEDEDSGAREHEPQADRPQPAADDHEGDTQRSRQSRDE